MFLYHITFYITELNVVRNVSGTTNAILKDINIHRFIYYCLSRKTSRNVSNQAWFHDPFQFLQRPLQYLFGTPSETLRLRWCESLPYKLCMDWSTCHLCLPQSKRAGPGRAKLDWAGSVWSRMKNVEYTARALSWDDEVMHSSIHGELQWWERGFNGGSKRGQEGCVSC